MTKSPTIVPLDSARYGEVAVLLTSLGLPTAGLPDHLSTALVALDGDSIVGCAALELYGKDALLRSVAVAAASQGLGIGNALFEAIIGLAKEKGVAQIYLLTETASDYFARRGFVAVERDHVPDSVQKSVEFTSACPASALAMRLILSGTMIRDADSVVHLPIP